MKKSFFACLVLALAAVLLISCGSTKADDSSTVTLRTIDDLSEYVIVRGEGSSSAVTALATKLRKAINDATGASVSVKTDYNARGGYEILVGKTDREQSINACKELRYYDYVIKLDGKKIVIAGGSEESLEDAVEFFKTNFIDSEKKTVKVPTGNGYVFKNGHPIDHVKISGVDISEFKLVNNSFYDLTEFRKEILDATGYELEVYDGKMLDDEHYIIIDGTELVVDKYSVEVSDGNVTIKGSAHSVSNAVEYFAANHLRKTDVKSVEITSADNFEGSTGKKEIYTKDQMMTVIEQVYADPQKVIIGGQTSGSKDADVVADTINAFKEDTGEMPGIIGIDLACYGIDLTRTNDMQWSSYICDLVDYAAGGGLITASAHWANPSETNVDRVRGNFGTVNTLEAYEQAFTDLLTEGTEYNEFFKNELEINARFFKALEENGVPIIWRPLHEANGGWFWFCTKQQGFTLDPSYVKNIWYYIYDYFNVECGLTNLLWCYGPNYSANVNDDPSSTMSASYLYPGDDYCDMVGVDWYTSGNLELTKNNNYKDFAEFTGKPCAITEFGPSGSVLADTIEEQPKLYNSMDLYGNLYELIREENSFVYLLTWTAKWSIPAMGKGDEFMQTDMTLGQAEVKAMLDAVK